MRIRNWLYNRFLPAWCKDDLMEKNQSLNNKVAALKQENDRLNAYIDGLELSNLRRITVNINGVKQ